MIQHVIERTVLKYGAWVDRDDVASEVRLYYMTQGRQLRKWYDGGEHFRVYRALFGCGKQYAEREKAEQSGYRFEDLAWYSPARLADLVPLALNPGWDGLVGEQHEAGMPKQRSVDSEGGTLLAMVCDIRRVLKGKKMSASDFDPTTETGQQGLRRLCELLGGEFPKAPGYQPRRKVLSNQQAIAKAEVSY